ncbi:MAG: DUF2007 domain-containing protein [Calditrichaceae bacterium]|nr:DUF2007 domain-containing protein [Calditrichaceae bacterium]
MKDSELIVVFEGTLVEVDLLKTKIEAEEITCFLKDNYMGTQAPFYTSIGGAAPIKLVVPKSDIKKVEPIIKEYIKKM